MGLGYRFYTMRISTPSSQSCEDEIKCLAQFLAHGILCKLKVSQVVRTEIAFRV